LWRIRPKGKFFRPPVAEGGRVFFSAFTGEVYAVSTACRQPSRGCLLWHWHHRGNKLEPIVAHGLVYVAGPEDVFAFRAGCTTGNRRCHPIRVWHVGRTITNIVVAGGRLFVNARAYMFVFRL
jgi:hypothetical protein